ncbi:ATP-dependent RNA helicase DbpA [Desulfotalea psychrophila]|uniref:Probable ATP-independent RNA helicase (DbpA) n=1 Tax=Desulfotalea psychrophila (strain LSv54 / DSM 12343) TaxID=177439 RepID=Q6ALS0_DESPS|nr:ATP-dependent RNA helicase DbpA [Desulfotalea psychrophila]CAG36705.1 probable ATP-independent RNA helicase (DbpA) [Desulfotalea psychrophila LSv54]
MSAFTTLALSKAMTDNLEIMGYHEMTPIQAESLPHVLEGEDLLAQAKTGSGKTAAFGIGLLHNLDVSLFRVQTLVMCPTRELAEQVAGELRRIARFKHNIKITTLCGGMPIKPQLASLEHQAHIVVGTPGRIEQHLKRESLNLDHVTTLVLDEADRMLDIGFADTLDAIISYLPRRRQTLLFSATFPDEILRLSEQFQYKAQRVIVDVEHEENSIQQEFFECKWDKKAAIVSRILATHKPESTLIFCNTKANCRDIAEALEAKGFSALAIHGDLDQRERTEVLVRFSNGSSPIMVATDVAARGLDINGLSAVINVDLPFESEVYIHRIGRTGRAGKEGLAFSLMEPGEEFRLEEINRLMGTDFKISDVEALAPAGKGVTALPPMVTLSINGGRKTKLRPGDILGALTKDAGIAGSKVGKINCFDFYSYVAIERSVADEAERALSTKKIKGRRFIIYRHEGEGVKSSFEY